MEKLLTFTVILAMLIITSCNDVKEDYVKDYKNVVEVTPEKCDDWGIEPVHFKISYPDDPNISFYSAEEGKNNLSYVMIDYLNKDGLSNEEISIGYCQNCVNSSEEELISLLEDIVNQFEEQIPNFKTESIVYEKLWGENMPVAKLSFNSDETLFNSLEAGNYKAMIVVFTKGSSTSNGVIIILLGNENSGIKEFSDFGEKGNLAGVFKTFRFVK